MALRTLIRSPFAFNYPCPRKLREVVKLSLVERETPSTIASIWQDYHRQKPGRNVAFVWQKDLYLRVREQAQRSKFFIFPVFRQGGHFNLLSQYQDRSFLFTYLEEFKRHASGAKPYLVVTCFEQLLQTKGICLVRGDVIDGQLSGEEAHSVGLRLLDSYSSAETYQQYVFKFNHEPQAFDYQSYIARFKP